MAQYRSSNAVTNALAALNQPAVLSTYETELMSKIRKTQKDIESTFPYFVPVDKQKFLDDIGVPYNPHATQSHSHPVHKAIENRLLSTIGHMIRDHPAVTFINMKRIKLQLLKRSQKSRDKDNFYNYTFEVKDLTRWANEELHGKINPVVVFHDTLHHWTPEQLATFCETFRVELVLATTVLPVEALHRHKSVYPSLYQISYSPTGFHYTPEGQEGGAYYHDNESLRWLNLSHIQSDEFHLYGQRVEQLYAHSLWAWTPLSLSHSRRVIFHPPTTVTLPVVFNRKSKYDDTPFPAKIVYKFYNYVTSMKKVTSRDISAKLRQMLQEDSITDWAPLKSLYLCNYMLLVADAAADNDSEDDLTLNIVHRFYNRLSTNVKSMLEGLTGREAYSRLIELIAIDEFTYDMDCTTYNCKTPGDIPGVKDWVSEYSEDDDADSFTSAPSDLPKFTAHEFDSPQGSNAPSVVADSVDAPILANSPLPKELLKANGFPASYIRRNDGVLLTPYQPTPCDLPLSKDLHEIAEVLRPMGRLFHRYTVNTERAAAFANDVKNNRTGAWLKAQPTLTKEGWANTCETLTPTVNICTILGAAGCGKSRKIQEFLRSYKARFLVVLPTTELTEDWKKKLPGKPTFYMKTFEKAFAGTAADLVIFDDCGKLPNGYIDAFLAVHPEVDHIILTGDTQQSKFIETNQDATICHLEYEISYFAATADFYLNASHRLSANHAAHLGICSYNKRQGLTSLVDTPPKGIPLLIPSHREKENLAKLGNHMFTYAGCQGLTVEKIGILLDRDTLMCSPDQIYTACSRATHEIVFINHFTGTESFQEKLAATPYLSTFLRLDAPIEVTVIKCEEPEVREPEAPPTHFPVDNTPILEEALIEHTPDPDAREIFEGEKTNVFQTEDQVVQQFAHQQAKDAPLLNATIKTRIGISTPYDNYISFIKSKSAGTALSQALFNALCLPVGHLDWDPILWDACVLEIDAKFLEKTVAEIIRGMERQDPDNDSNKLWVNLKSQWVKKCEKLGKPAKAGQTIASFVQATVMKFGAMARYVRRIIQRYLPKNMFLHCEKTNDQFNDFVLNNWNFMIESMANDFTAFDAAQDGSILNMEVDLLKKLSMPEELIDSYIYIKCNAKFFGGIISIMRLSGEGPTWDFNTLANIAFTHLKYVIPTTTAQAYAGDDSAINGTFPVNPFYKLFAELIGLKAKTVITNKPEFCGWRITPLGIVKDPFKLFTSLVLAQHLNKMDNAGPSYALDMWYAYRHGDAITTIFNEQDQSYHAATVRMLKNYHYRIAHKFADVMRDHPDYKPVLDSEEFLDAESTIERTSLLKRFAPTWLW